ncbi:MAG: hypothetical protein NWQ64_02260 [Paracoccaceae bacterium]|jgi:predicted amidophosphoribosyltransferase|nr:hypothetical protein [Pseudomonadota bacterium]MDO7568908.1 hypothetical protein [Paracoccaceae bacterium]HCK06911.1 hypothetical protein [Rhodobacter sp.]MDA1043471.1 hypothetical protein [Pseudomonadota bacterium]MDO7733669.1 hypothetical protein [Paracoccaceae bacterium]
MADRFCTACDGKVYFRTKICPGCGGNFRAIYGPRHKAAKGKVLWDEQLQIGLFVGLVLLVLYVKFSG